MPGRLRALGDFGHTIARTWPEVRAVWRIVYLTREGVREALRRGHRLEDPAGGQRPKNKGKSESALDADLKKAVIYEIWDKVDRKVTWLCKEYHRAAGGEGRPAAPVRLLPLPAPAVRHARQRLGDPDARTSSCTRTRPTSSTC
jgi:hypothetical protein